MLSPEFPELRWPACRGRSDPQVRQAIKAFPVAGLAALSQCCNEMLQYDSLSPKVPRAGCARRAGGHASGGRHRTAAVSRGWSGWKHQRTAYNGRYMRSDSGARVQVVLTHERISPFLQSQSARHPLTAKAGEARCSRSGACGGWAAVHPWLASSLAFAHRLQRGAGRHLVTPQSPPRRAWKGA